MFGVSQTRMIICVTPRTKWALRLSDANAPRVSVRLLISTKYKQKTLRTCKEIPKSPPSISDYALTRRQFHIFERALQKFKSDVSLWLQYLRVAQREGARALAGRIAARAVQLHPRTPALYVLAAAHELAHGGIGAARTLLLRGIRLNADSTEMWREYVRLELGFVEAVRRRWGVLGITLESDDEEEGERVDRAEEQAMGDAARREIMDGAIVRQAIDSAAKGERSNKRFAGCCVTYRYKITQLCRRSICFRVCKNSLRVILSRKLCEALCWTICTND